MRKNAVGRERKKLLMMNDEENNWKPSGCNFKQKKKKRDFS